ncbi:MAG: hemerythrin domain-containing protein [Actinobacteria bacterium]|nr:hemerythrin domain-containing protein [Actinomycetota bacterium]
MDAVELLTKEHEEAKQMFEQIDASTEPAEKERLLGELMTALRAHTKIEEEVLYAPVREQLKGGSKMFEEAMQEHQEAKKAMKKLDGLSATEPEWQDQFEILMHGVLHHAKEEEAEMFPKLRETFSQERLDGLGEQLAADKSGQLVVDLTVEELTEQAKASDIEGRSSMDKGELEKALGHR